jgi:hypothetical protein
MQTHLFADLVSMVPGWMQCTKIGVNLTLLKAFIVERRRGED